MELKIDDTIVEVRRPRDVDEYRKIMDVQADIWGMPDYSEAVTYHLLIAADRHGGLVLGAFEKHTGKPIGMVFGFPAFYEGKLIHYSHMAGVIQKYRFKGIGYLLKLEQRKYVLEQGLDLIVWTYDPLQAANAKFNVGKLGVIVRRFYKDYYGELRNSINVGMPTDRFKAEWWIKSKRVTERIKGYKEPKMEDVIDAGGVVVTKTVKRNDITVLVGYDLNCTSDIVIAEIPKSLDELRPYRDELLKWRFGLREVFINYLGRGYIVADVVTVSENGRKRVFYVLWRTSLENVLEGKAPWT